MHFRRGAARASIPRVRVRELLLSVLLGGALAATASAQAAPGAGKPQPGGLGGLFSPRRSEPAPAAPALSQIDARLRELARRSDAGNASAAIAAGRRALERARAALAAGRSAEAERARRMAWAALSLAGREVAAARAELVRAAAERRADAAQQRLASARQARQQAQARLDALRARPP